MIPTYLPIKDIRDWRYQEGYWRDVEPAQTTPPADTAPTTSLGVFAVRYRTALLAAISVGVGILAILLLVLIIIIN